MPECAVIAISVTGSGGGILVLAAHRHVVLGAACRLCHWCCGGCCCCVAASLLLDESPLDLALSPLELLELLRPLPLVAVHFPLRVARVAAVRPEIHLQAKKSK